MKNRKKMLVVLAAAAALTLSSCSLIGNDQPESLNLSETETQTQTEVPTEVPTETEAPTETEPPTEAETEPAYKTANGTVTDITADTITIYSKKGRTLTFTTTGAEMLFPNGINSETSVSVNYEGEITDDDASAADVKVISVAAADSGTEAYTVEAVSQIVYTTDDVNVRSVPSTNGAKLGGIPKGHALTQTGRVGEEWIQISYAGRSGYVSSQFITANEAEAPETEMGLEDYSGEDLIKTVSGTIVSVDLLNIEILSDNGNNLQFGVYSTYLHVTNGLSAGNYITVEYNGEIGDDNSTDTVMVISFTDSGAREAAASEDVTAESTPDTQAPEAAPAETAAETAASEAGAAESTNATVTGTVTGYTQNSVTVQLADGSSLIFAYDQAAMELSNGIQEGISVSVTYNAANVYESGVYDAVMITDAGEA